ncbi:hypothetical protein LXA43DRAFT_390195 [Ganoderma leucocontextum]|nr:hypothetical protein LXA43DRAFT_390195 [Ganoderma leucocontextum]
MSSQDSFVPDPIPTLLLAMQKIWHYRPERSLDNLLHLIGSKSYRFLDAIATLCTFTPECDAAAAMMGSEKDRGQLCISVRPAASPELQVLVQKLLPLVQSLPNTPSTLLDVSKAGFDISKMLKSLDTATPDHQIIIAVFRACYPKFCASVTAKGGCPDLLAALPKHGQTGFRGELKTLSAKLDYLLNAASRDVDGFSDAELLRLYYTADDVLVSTMRMRARLPTIVSSAMKKLEILPRAVRYILGGARKEWGLAEHLGNMQHSDIQWITSPAPQSFSASTDEDYIRDNIGTVAKDVEIYRPLGPLVEEAPQCFTGSAVLHPEAALLGYVCEHKVNMSGYIGSSPPICYPCYMLLCALNPRVADEDVVDVSKCSFCIPLPWCPPPMDSDVLKRFRDLLVEDYVTILGQERARYLQYQRDLVSSIPASNHVFFF